jgi:ATP-binding cassette subfamily B protein|tara:strand:+ start:471 stop:2087 length:1617 start_codon:yes stop_codon:yes gene_type:complete
VKQFKKILTDVLYISKITKTNNKKILTIISVILSQFNAYTDILIIAIFSSLIASQSTSINFVNRILDFFVLNPLFIILLVVFRYIFQYFQKTIIYKLELSVNKNLKIHILNEIFDKRNYSVSDSYYFINVISMHISYFFSSFASFLNNLLQIIVYVTYLFLTDVNTVIVFGAGIALLAFPIKKILDKARMYMHESFEKGQDSNKEVERVVDNLLLIKILKKDDYEIKRFTQTIEKYIFNLYNNFKFGVVNSFLPSFFTLFLLSSVLALSSYAKNLTLDFIGVTLRLFQSLSNLTTSLNQIINSHVHMEKFYEIELNKTVKNDHNFQIFKTPTIGMEKVTFKYLNNDEPIFQNISFNLPRDSHTVVTGQNGSGKSTLLGLIAGVFYADTGKVFSFSDNYGYIGATPLIFNAPLIENIMYGNEKNVSKEEIIQNLKLLDTFKEKANYDLNRIISNKELSSGQMQKIAFVRALVAEPTILLLDEATSNLDDSSKEKIFKILKNRKITIINSTHDPDKFQNVDFNLNIEINNEIRKVRVQEL